MELSQQNWMYGNGRDLVAWDSHTKAQPQPLSVSKNGQRKTRLLLLLIAVFLIGGAIAIGVYLSRSTGTTQAPQTTTTTPALKTTTKVLKTTTTTTTRSPQITTSPSIYLTIDSITYQSAQDITIDQGSHTFECTARNVEFGSSLVWDFGDNSIQTPRWTPTTLSKEEVGLIDVTSTVTVDSISPGARDSYIACSTIGSGARRQRQTLNVPMMITIAIQSPPLAGTITLQIDASTYVFGTTVTLDEGPHNFECSATNARSDADIFWVFGQSKNIPPNLATSSASGGVPQTIRSTINGLEITDDYCDTLVTCYVGSSCPNPSDATGLHSVTITLRVKTAPSTTTLTPLIDASMFNSVTRSAEVIEDVKVDFLCQIAGTTTGDANVVFTLNQSSGTPSVTYYPETSTGISCSKNLFTETVSLTLKHDQHHAQSLECIASNSAGTTAVSVVHLDVLVPPTKDNMEIRVDGEVYPDDSVVVLTEGDHDFQCVTSYTNPASTVIWEFGENRVAGDAYTLMTSGGLISNTSFMYSRALYDTNCNEIVTCAATNKAVPDGETPPTVGVTLRVNNAPTDVTLSVTSGLGSTYDPSTQVMTLTDGISYILSCTVNGADEEPDVTWILTSPSTPMMPVTEVDSAVTSGVDCIRSQDTETFDLTASYAAHNRQVLTCNASNSDGSASASITLNIQDDWTQNTVLFQVDSAMVSNNAVMGAFENVPIEFACSVPDATPAADITLDFGGVTENVQTSTRSFTSDTVVTCMGSNEVGSASIRVTFNIVEAANCNELLNTYGVTKSGAYYIYPGAGSEATRMQVWCDMDTDGGGWTVFQSRKDGSVDFHRGWTGYADGFGDVEGEFWLGNDDIHILTNSDSFQLRVDLDDGTTTVLALYDSFVIANGNDKYELTLGTYDTSSSTAGDGLGPHNNNKFTTLDQDNDLFRLNCAGTSGGGWWYYHCHSSNLNGFYLGNGGVLLPIPNQSSNGFLVSWTPLKGIHFALKKTEMKLRPLAAK